MLDLPRTREWLETHGVTILGYKFDELPAFYSHKSSLNVDEKVGSIAEIVEIANARNKLDLPNAILVTVPVPKKFEIEAEELEQIFRKVAQTCR